MSVLEVNNLQKSFGKTEVLKGISFSIDKGEVVSIIGSSGSGKTTLLRCLNFLETADGGTIVVEITWTAQEFVRSDSIIWPVFYSGLFYLLFSGLLTLIFGLIERKLNYYEA